MRCMMLRVTLLTVITGVAVLLIGAPRAHADGIFDKLKAFFTSDETVGSATDMAAAALSNEDMIAGLKEALDVGARTVVSQLGRPDGFLKDEAIRIALPKSLQKADQTLSRFGLGALTDGVKERMNRAAEAAVPEAQDLFVIAVRDMSISDAAAILAGPDDAATQYFKSTMGADLRQRMAPIVSASVADAGVIVAAQNAVDKLP
ncbi:MAG: DUF4197 domain-containing protein, partial [Pseudomonadota bacterium]